MFRALIVVMGCSLALDGAVAFGTINSLGQSAEHEKITRLGLRGLGFGPKSLSELAGKTGTFGAVGAPDRPDRGLLTNAAAHCDGGDTLAVPGYPQSAAQAAAKLAACKAWIVRFLNRAVRDAGGLLDAGGGIRSSQIPTYFSCTYNGSKGRAKCNVFEALGLAFHAGQDFYSHTNWTDIAASGPSGPDNPPGLGQTKPAPWLDPGKKSRFPDGLISGCFGGIPERLFCKDAQGRPRVRHSVLNKDKGAITVGSGRYGPGRTERGKQNNNFARAAKAAVLDTRHKWMYFERRVRAKYGKAKGSRILCALKRDDADGCR